MYEELDGFAENPFSLTPDPKYYFASASHAAAVELVRYAVGRGEAFIAVTGDIGTGKTTLCRAILEGLDRRVLTALVVHPPASEEEMLRVILQEFGVMSREIAPDDAAAVTRQAMIDALIDFVASLRPLGARALIVIDEAHHMPARLLEQLRMLANAETDTQKLLQVLLVGHTELRETLRQPGLLQLQQRIPVTCELKPMSRDETATYVAHRLTVAGGLHVSFSSGALARVHGCTRGVPRLVNLVCDRALHAACADRTDGVRSVHVDRAAESLDLARPNRLLLAWAR